MARGAVLVVLLAAPSSAEPTVWIVLPEALLSVGIRLVVLTRVGLLAGMVNGFVFLIFFYPITFDTSAWYAPVGYVYLAVVAAIAFYGFRTSLGGRPVLELPGFAD